MLDEEVVACVAAAACHSGDGARIEPLSGKQGLLICRVRLPGRGSFIFKAVRASGRRELALSARLSCSAPSVVPGVLAWEEDTRRDLYWLVSEDVGESRLADRPSAEGYVAAAQRLAELQLATLSDSTAFRDLGLPWMDVPDWEDLALRTLETAQRCESPLVWGHLSELERVVWGTTDVARDTVGLPMALVHGDLHAGNIALSPGTPPEVRLLDWGSAYVGAALLGLAELLWPAARHLQDANAANAVRAAYFRVWMAVLGRPGRLERAFAACQVLVRLALLEDGLRGPAVEAGSTEYAAALAARNLLGAWRTWQRTQA